MDTQTQSFAIGAGSSVVIAALKYLGIAPTWEGLFHYILGAGGALVNCLIANPRNIGGAILCAVIGLISSHGVQSAAINPIKKQVKALK